MELSFKRSASLKDSAKFTYDNMRNYYERYSVDWDVHTIATTTESLDNFDIFIDGNIAGVFRLQFEGVHCFLRDLQIHSSFQKRGVGTAVLNEVKQRTRKSGLNTLKLRVFKISPAVSLYKRNGFVITDEDDRFFNMQAALC